MEAYKVVFHIDESSKWGILLANVKNLIKDLGRDNIIIEVVANGAAVAEYLNDINEANDISSENEVAGRIYNLSKLGVDFAACRNSLAANKMEEKLLPDFIKVVPAGITELIKKQAEGYSYIKP